VADRDQVPLGILPAGKVGHPLSAGHLVVPLLLPALNTGGTLNALPGDRPCPDTLRLEEGGIEPGPLSLASAELPHRNLNRRIELGDIGTKPFSYPGEGVDIDYRASFQGRTWVNTPKLAITSSEQPVSCTSRVAE